MTRALDADKVVIGDEFAGGFDRWFAEWDPATVGKLDDHAIRKGRTGPCRSRPSLREVISFGARKMLSARNQLPATVKSVKLGNVMAEVVMTVGEVELVAAITRGSAEALDLKAGDSVRAVIKSTEVLIDK